jgi:hypothetical protein
LELRGFPGDVTATIYFLDETPSSRIELP